jgi:hypothetical protein
MPGELEGRDRNPVAPAPSNPARQASGFLDGSSAAPLVRYRVAHYSDSPAPRLGNVRTSAAGLAIAVAESESVVTNRC